MRPQLGIIVSSSFADLGVPAELVALLKARGIAAPFPIQEATLRDGLAGRDVSGRAPTGSGKTLAFGIPLVVDCNRAKPKRPRRLVLVPTRELATQVCSELRLLAGSNGPRIDAIFGGVSQQRQVTALRRGVDIVVACPGRLMDLIDQNQIRLDGIDMVVLDEADRMSDMGFLPEVRKLLDMCPSDRRTILFSATLDGDVDVLVKHYQNDPVRHEVETPESEQGEVDHHFWTVSRNDRVSTTAQVIDRMGPTVVFCRTKRGAERLAEQLEQAGVDAVAIHGDRSQNQRDRALEQFKRGRAAALVATDVAARGIHVDDVAAVIHFDPPEDPKDYVHRSGRTGRAGNRGVVVSLVPQEKRKMVSRMQRDLSLPSGFDVIDLTALGEPAERKRPARPSNRLTRTDARREAAPARKSFGERQFERNTRNENTGGRGGSGGGRRGSDPRRFGSDARSETRTDDRRDGNRSYGNRYDSRGDKRNDSRGESRGNDRGYARRDDRRDDNRSAGSGDGRGYARRDDRDGNRSDGRRTERNDRGYAGRDNRRSDDRSFVRRDDRDDRRTTGRDDRTDSRPRSDRDENRREGGFNSTGKPFAKKQGAARSGTGAKAFRSGKTGGPARRGAAPQGKR
jgi:superfamily II DNA/RNA helicase